jgi:hypothetical protein
MSQNEVKRWCERARVELGELQSDFDQATVESERQRIFREQVAMIDYYVEWLSRSIDLQAAMQAISDVYGSVVDPEIDVGAQFMAPVPHRQCIKEEK